MIEKPTFIFIDNIGSQILQKGQGVMAKVLTEKQLYGLKNEYLLKDFEKVTTYDFYRDMFPIGSMEQAGNLYENKPNLIFTRTYAKNGEVRAFNTIVFDDLAGINDIKDAEFAVTSPVLYRGRNRTAANAHNLWGFCIDLDGVGMEQLADLLFQIQNKILPEPTYLVNSGHGFHVYYLLEEPIPLYRNLHKPLNNFKHGLTKIVWNVYTSNIPPDKRQYQGIFQGFRMPGSQSKLGKRYPVVAFRFGRKCTVEYLNSFVEEQYKLSNDWDKYRLPLEEAKEKYPQWYQRVIIEGDKSRKKWDISGKVHGENPYALYDWWIRKLKAGAFDGNRYNCIATLMTYGVKCDIPKEKVLDDALQLVPWLNSLTSKKNNNFTEQDVYDACTYFDDCYATYSIKAIEAKTRIDIEKNKRNGRKQKEHIKLMNFVRDEINGNKDWWNKSPHSGRKPKAEIVAQWRKDNPDGKKIDCSRETGLHINTVYKWWNEKE